VPCSHQRHNAHHKGQKRHDGRTSGDQKGQNLVCSIISQIHVFLISASVPTLDLDRLMAALLAPYGVKADGEACFIRLNCS